MAQLLILKRRPEFLFVNGGARVSRPGFVLLGRARDARSKAAPAATRFGLTVTKRIGSAVERNRARRRLRALARARLAADGRPGWDYVLIARAGALTCDFRQLDGELESALEMLHKAGLLSERRAQTARDA